MKSIRVVVLSMLGGLLASACGGGGGTVNRAGTTPLHAIQLASTKTTDAGSSRVSLTVNMSGAAIPNGSLALHGSGLFDYKDEEGRLSMPIPSLAGNPGGTITMLFQDGAIYERIPSGGSSMVGLGGKAWIKIDISSAFGQAQGGFFNVGSPDQNLQFLGGVTKATDQGGADVRGVATEHYLVEIDLSKAAEQLPASFRRSVAQVEKALGSSSFPADVYIDDQGRLRRMHLSFSIDPGAIAGGAGLQAGKGNYEFAEIVDLYDFGVTVDVTPPPASQVTDVTGLFQTGSSGSK